MLNARTPIRMWTRTRARALPAPDINKCVLIAAMVSAVLMLAVGLTFDDAIGPALAWLGR